MGTKITAIKIKKKSFKAFFNSSSIIQNISLKCNEQNVITVIIISDNYIQET